jgi:hypothetical protein
MPRLKGSLVGLFVLLLLAAFLSGSFAPYAKRMLYSAADLPTARADSAAAVVTLQKGDYIFLGRYLRQPILWRVVAVKQGRPLLFSEYALCFKAFAASENPLAGSSSWQASALRLWLNSKQSVVAWTGAPPIAANVYEGHNAYASEPGFLSRENFTSGELACIAPGDDKVFLLTQKQLQAIPAARRKKAFTQAALRQDDSPYWNARKYGWYWAADPIATNTQSVVAVTSRSAFYKSLATDGSMGVCPALYCRAAAFSLCGKGTKAAPYQIRRRGIL